MKQSTVNGGVKTLGYNSNSVTGVRNKFGLEPNCPVPFKESSKEKALIN